MLYQNVSNRADHLLEQGQFHLTGSQPQDAVLCLQEATRLYPLNAEPYTLLGKILAMQGDHAAAAVSLRRAAALAPHAWENHALLGASLCTLGRHREAILCYRRAIPLNAQNLELYARLAQLLGTIGKNRGGVSDLGAGKSTHGGKRRRMDGDGTCVPLSARL